jgi:dipeptidyl aminopeptidase/acylaminoacyl peptidase
MTKQSIYRIIGLFLISLVLAFVNDLPCQATEIHQSRIAFSSNRDGNLEIYTMNPDGSDIVRITDHPAKDAEPKWSPDGQQIAFKSARDGNNEIYIMDVNGKSVLNLTHNPASDEDCSWSPDSQQLCFCSNRDGNFEIYKMRSNGEDLTRLTSHSTKDLSPCWSPCGKLIVFISWREEPDGIYIMNADGTDVKRLPVTGGNPRWSPDGKKIIFHHTTDGNMDIWSIKEDGTGLNRLTDDVASEGLPSYSPDGSQIAFIRIVSGKSAIFIMKNDGTGVHKVSPQNETCISPFWSPLLSSGATSTPILGMKNDVFHLEVIQPGSFRDGPIEVGGQKYQTTFVTFSVRLSNLSSQKQTIDVSSGFELVHPGELDAFRLLKEKPGPYILEFAAGEKKECEIQYIMNPSLYPLSSKELDSLEWETFLGRAKIPLEKQIKAE